MESLQSWYTFAGWYIVHFWSDNLSYMNSTPTEPYCSNSSSSTIPLLKLLPFQTRLPYGSHSTRVSQKIRLNNFFIGDWRVVN